MPWTLPPTARTDIILEVRASLDESGNYSGDWIDTAGVLTALVSCKFNTNNPVPYLWVEHGAYITDQSSPPSICQTILFDLDPNDHTQGATTITMLARYFRIGVWAGSPESSMVATVRKLT